MLPAENPHEHGENIQTTQRAVCSLCDDNALHQQLCLPIFLLLKITDWLPMYFKFLFLFSSSVVNQFVSIWDMRCGYLALLFWTLPVLSLDNTASLSAGHKKHSYCLASLTVVIRDLCELAVKVLTFKPREMYSWGNGFKGKGSWSFRVTDSIMLVYIMKFDFLDWFHYN